MPNGCFKPDVAIYCLTGEKTAQLLHGQLTNHIKALTNHQANYNLLLSQKGKVMADLYVYRHGQQFYLVIAREHATNVIDHLAKLAPLSRVDIKEVSSEFNLYHVTGCKEDFQNETSYPAARLDANGRDYLIASQDIEKFETTLQQNNISTFDLDKREALRIENGIPLYGVDVDDKNLPQESRLDHALHFEKGCYLGQEIIARLHYKGHVNKILVGLQSENPVKVGDEIFADEKSIGKITSVSQNLALGYLSYKKMDAKQIFYAGVDKIEIKIRSLPVLANEKPATPS